MSFERLYVVEKLLISVTQNTSRLTEFVDVWNTAIFGSAYVNKKWKYYNFWADKYVNQGAVEVFKVSNNFILNPMF